MFKHLANNTIVHVLLLFLVAVFTFLPTLEMHFFLDDWGGISNLAHGGLNFDWPPHLYTAYFLNLLFVLFGVDPTGYFAVGILVYVLSVITFYFLVSSLLKNKVLGLVAGLIYATTPVGTNTVFMVWTYVIEGGYPMNLMLLVLLYVLLRYFRERKIFYYLFALCGFMLLLEWQPRRAFLFLPIIFLFDYLMHFKLTIPNQLHFVRRQLPFLVAFILYYTFTQTLWNVLSGKTLSSILSGGLEAQQSYDSHTKLQLGIDSLTHMQPLITLTNILLGAPWMFASERLTGYVNLADIEQVSLVVFITLFVVAALIILAFKIKKEWGLLLLFSLGWIYTNILGIYVFSSPGVSETTHRTLSLAAPAYALFITLSGAVLYTLLGKRKGKLRKNLNGIFFLAFIIFLAVSFLATRHNFEKFNSLRSRPAQAFFKKLKHFYPTLPADSLIYIETSSDPQIKNRLVKIYGDPVWAGAGSITAFYPEITWQEIDIVRDFAQVEKFVGDDSSRIDRVFAFYFDENGLSDVTDDIRTDLRE